MKVREVVAFKHYFEDFLLAQPEKIQEARIQLGSDIWRVFCFFDGDRLVILLNGFQKKTAKTPKGEIEKAKYIMREYYQQKTEENGN